MKNFFIGTDIVGEKFNLPEDMVTQTAAVIAKKGSGKSYTASVIAEEMLKQNHQVVVIDPTGAWWGLRADAKGGPGGFPIIVIGGDHADVNLDEGSGEVLARAIVERKFSAILDVSNFRKGQTRRFVTAFLETIYRLNREPMHLFVDEADDICPQMVRGEEAQMVGALEDVVKRGRKKGIGCTLITQRPADLAKQVLTQVEMLMVLRLSHPRDLKAIEEWINVHADPTQAKDMMRELPGLPIGQAYFWSPGWLNILKVIKVRTRNTFDSGATPKPGQIVRAPKALAKVDVDLLGKEIAATVEKARDNDPAHLRKQIAELNKKITTLSKPVPERVETKQVKVEVVSAAVITRIEKVMDRGIKAAESIVSAIAELKAKMPRVGDVSKPSLHKPAVLKHADRPGPAPVQHQPRQDSSSADLPVGEKTILEALIQFPSGLRRDQLTVLTGYKRSTRDTYIQRLREKGLCEPNGAFVAVTSHGQASLPDANPLPTGVELQEIWRHRLPEGERKIMELCIEQYPEGITRDEISNLTGYKRSTRDTYIQRMLAKMVIQTQSRGRIMASENLF